MRTPGTSTLPGHPCRRCAATVITGLDGHRAAIHVTADPHPLTPLGEARAIADGRGTYQHAGRQLHHRTRWNIPGRPPSDRVAVLAEHRCGQPLPDAWIAPTAPATPPRDTTEVPF